MHPGFSNTNVRVGVDSRTGGYRPEGRWQRVSVLLIAVIATIAVVWATVAVVVSVLVGRSISLADKHAIDEAPPLDDRVLVDQT